MFPDESRQALNGRVNIRSARPLSTTAPSTGGGIYGAGAGVPLPSEIKRTVVEVETERRDVASRQEALQARRLRFEPFADVVARQRRYTGLRQLYLDPFEARGTQAPNTETAAQQGIRVPGEIRLFEKVMEQWGLGETEAAKLLGYEDPSILRALYSGRTSLRTIDEKDRLRAVLRIAGDLLALFRDEGEIRAWLREPKVRLGGKSAYDLMMNGSMEYLLYVRQFVEFLSGR